MAMRRCTLFTGTERSAGDTTIDVSTGTVNVGPLLAVPDTVTTTGPVVAVAGATAPMLVALQLVVAAVVPLNFTVLEPLVDPKFDPAIVTAMAGGPDAGERLVIVG